MKTYVLLSIGKNSDLRLVGIVLAETIQEAAGKLGGTLADARRVGEQDHFRHYFDVGNECGMFLPGPCTHEVLAASSGPGLKRAVRDLVAYYRYGTLNCHKGYVLGEPMTVR